MKSRRSRWRKIFRTFSWMTLIFSVLIVLTYIIIRIQFPPAKIKQLIGKQLKIAMNNRNVKIEDVHLNPFKGFTVDNIRIFEPLPEKGQASDSTIFLSIKRTYLKYKLSSIFRKKIKIVEISLESPYVHVSIDQESRTNLDDLLLMSSEETQVSAPDTSQTTIDLPVSFELDAFNFTNFSAHISSEMKNLKIDTRIHDFSIYLKNLSIPRGPWEIIKGNIAAQLKMASPHSLWDFNIESTQISNPLSIHAHLDMNMDLLMSGFEDIRINGQIGFSDISKNEAGSINRLPLEKLLHVMLDLRINGDQELIEVNQFVTQFIDQDFLSAKGSISSFLTDPKLLIVLENQDIQLSKLSEVIKAILPAEFEKQFRDVEMAGVLFIKDTEISGKLNSPTNEEGLHLKTGAKLTGLKVFYPTPATLIDGLSANIDFSGLLNRDGLQESRLNVQGKILSLSSSLNDTTTILLNDIALNSDMLILNDNFPSRVTLTAQVNQIFGGSVDIDFKFESMDKLTHFMISANANINQLKVEEFPQSPATGLFSGNLAVSGSDIEHLLLNFKMWTDSLKVSTETEKLVILPVTSEGFATIRTNPDFNDIRFDRIEFAMNNFFSFYGSAKVEEMAQKGFELVIDSILVKHEQLFEFIPMNVKQGMETLEIGGKTVVTGIARGKVPVDGEPEIFAELNGEFKAHINYPDIPVRIGSLNGKLNLKTNGLQAQGDGIVSIDEFVMEGLRDRAINNSSLLVKYHLPDFTRLKIDTAVLVIPDLDSRADLSGEIDSLDSNPLMHLDLVFDFSSEDSVLVINDLFLIGEMDAKAQVSVKYPFAQVNAQAQVNRLHVRFGDEIEIRQISGKIFLSQKYDIENSLLMSDDRNTISGTNMGTLNYNILTPYYKNATEESSYLFIERIRAFNYEASDFQVDLKLGNAKIEIPEFLLNLYEGNMNGVLSADLSAGQLDKITYYLKANVSRLNSAKLSLSGSGSAEASELNMNMEIEGIGLDPLKKIDFGGYFYITKIGSKFTENVLNSLDPKGTDKSIQDTKRLLKWGYKPKLISFEIKHGYMYPAIHLVKGNILTKLIPLNLSSGKIELARIPIQFFLNQQLNSVQ